MDKKLLTFFFSFIPLFLMAQDIVVLKTGDKIKCRILREDTANVEISYKRSGMKTVRMIQKIEVEKLIYNANKGVVSATQLAYHVGGSFSNGPFGSDDVFSDEAGLAGNGLNMSAAYTHFFFRPEIGFTVKGFYNTNAFKAEKISNTTSLLTGASVDNNEVSYKSYGLMGGPTFMISLDKVSFSGRMLVGYGSLTQPSVTFNIYTPTNKGWVKMTETSGSGLILDAGTGLQFAINDVWDFALNVDYIFGSMKMRAFQAYNSAGAYVSSQQRTQKYGVTTVSAGFVIKM